MSVENPEQINKFLELREYHAKIYLQKYKHWLKWNPKGKDTVLDIGCATGRLSHELIYPIVPKDYSKYLCTVKSPALLDEVKKAFVDDPKVSFEVFDLNAESKSKLGVFDHIFSLFSFGWLADQRKCFQGVYELLSPGGDCFLIFAAGSLYMDVLTELNGKARWKKFVPNPDEMYPFPYRKDPDPVKSVTEMMESIGFVNINVKLEKSLYVFATTDEFLGFFKGLPNPLQHMTTIEQEDYLKQAADIAIGHNLIGEMSDRKPNDTVSEVFVIYGRKNGN
ncbi:juvenile hormone acid O-methyltransferase-like [Phlebotomus argentipes]|uniref:juvenile hormone acid O-methyltransferase-like n=1 Tax=Phlebotomus argentipes TaxID=94469 RepID=UPI0028934C1B|nr:juvenile hormone acid O-methyltransferase-like [Phlebotomus argentipes]